MTITIISLILLGFAVGTFGTLIGAGGGFILVPVLLIMYPEQTPETITTISLAVVFFNALSGTVVLQIIFNPKSAHKPTQIPA